ncbi:MAG: hypothetical protein DI537_53720, partial [Stutzerimonas stutzeri]
MNRPRTPTPDELPTLQQLNRATLGAFVAAAIIVVTTVLPAEYGVDPTGIGGVLGLTPMGEMKQAEHAAKGAQTPAPATAGPPAPPVAPANHPAKVVLTLQPNEGREVKATMKAGE